MPAWCAAPPRAKGLGNQFLANIREVDAIVHVLRCFEDDDITHVEGRIDPVADAETVKTELMLADLDSLERRVPQIRKRAAGKDKEAMAELPLMEARARAAAGRQAGARCCSTASPPRRSRVLQGLEPADLASRCSMSATSPRPTPPTGNEHTRGGRRRWLRRKAPARVVISAAIEAEVAQLSDAEEHEFLAALGLDEPGLDRLIRAGYELLDLITYFTAGPKETRAWTVHKGTKAPQAAGVIHTDFERGFIRAQTIAYDDFVTLGGEVAAKEAGKARDEGKEYVVQDGDIMLFKFNT